MLPSRRDKNTGYIYKLRTKLESKIDKECNAELGNISKKPASDSEDEQESGISGTTKAPFSTSLKMTCSDSEDSLESSANSGSISLTSHIKQHPEMAVKRKANEPLSKEPTIVKVLNILTSMSKRVKKMQEAFDFAYTEVGIISNRLSKIEEVVDTTITTLVETNDCMAKSVSFEENPESNSQDFHFDFKKISNEAEFTEFDSKLGNDKEYYSAAKKWLTVRIQEQDPDNRMHLALDLVFERTFVPLCCWGGRGRTEPKIAFKTRTNILKLFADIGSTKFKPVDGFFVQKFFLKKLPHAKNRLNLSGNGISLCHKQNIN